MTDHPPIPTCAVCGRPADRLDWWYEDSSHAWVFEVHCHGESERTVLPVRYLECGPIILLSGVAFKQEARRIDVTV